MTQDLKDHVLISKDLFNTLVYKTAWVQRIMGIAVYGVESKLAAHDKPILEAIIEAMKQDLSGTINVPIKLTKEMFWAGERAINQKEKPVVAWDVWEAMLSAAQKEKSDD